MVKKLQLTKIINKRTLDKSIIYLYMHVKKIYVKIL